MQLRAQFNISYFVFNVTANLIKKNNNNNYNNNNTMTAINPHRYEAKLRAFTDK